jgi:hypothetical protein
MNGKDGVLFSDLFRDTLDFHGMEWTHWHYVTKNGMALREFRFWARKARLGT